MIKFILGVLVTISIFEGYMIYNLNDAVYRLAFAAQTEEIDLAVYKSDYAQCYHDLHRTGM